MQELVDIYAAAQDIASAKAMGIAPEQILRKVKALRRRLDAASEHVRALATSSSLVLNAVRLVY